MNARAEILLAIDQLGQLYPSMRFGQIVLMVTNWATEQPDAVYDVEDDDFLKTAQLHLKRRADALGEPNHPVVSSTK